MLRHDYDSDGDFLAKLISTAELEPCRDELKRSPDGKTLERYLGGSERPRIPEGIEEIGPRAIVTPAARRVVVPEGVKQISAQAFIGCGRLEELELPDTLERILPGAFLGCSSLREVSLPPLLAEVPEDAFAGCVSLERVTFRGNSVQDIMPRAFEDCVSLTQVDWPTSVKRLWPRAFANCTSLDLEIPASVELVTEGSAYGGCNSVRVHPDNKYYSFRDGCLLSRDGKTLYNVSPSVAIGDFRVPDGVQKTASSIWPKASLQKAFQDAADATSLGAARNGEPCGKLAFAGCRYLVSVELPDGMRRIGESAFEGCSSLARIGIPDSVNRIGANAFKGCSSLASVTLPDGLKWVEAGVFEGCSSLACICVPQSATSIGGNAFRGCGIVRSRLGESHRKSGLQGLRVACSGRPA